MSLRERKKLEAWRAIRAAALQLFDERGFEAVTVEQIVKAANVSRPTFFNYFASKEAVVFDRDPEELDAWRALMAERPEDEALWTSLTAVLIAFNERHGDFTPIKARIKARSPALVRSKKDDGEQFLSDLREWALSRRPKAERPLVLLQVNAALTAASTAYQLWSFERPHAELLALMKQCLDHMGNGFHEDTRGERRRDG